MDLGKLVVLSERRECRVCGRVYRSEKGLSAMQQLVAHMIEHQPSPERWTVAYERIRERMPKRQKGMSGDYEATHK